MAKNQNSAEKRRREIEKKFKAEEKRKNRQKKKREEPLGPSLLEISEEKLPTADENPQ